jgi:abequosyltransferase
MEILLTIAIPTYNRSRYLDLCLGQIQVQIGKGRAGLELIVSNNNSDDNTTDVIKRYAESGLLFRYVENSTNIGADRNIAQCFSLAQGRYVLILGDDDVLLDHSIESIFELLSKEEFGLVYLSAYSFKNDYILERPDSKESGVIVYDELDKFVDQVNYMVTFLSANIVNKSLVPHDVDLLEFSGTNLLQLQWTLSALFCAKKNAYIKNYMVAAKAENTGGYRLCQVFGVNINKIFDSFIAKGINREYFRVINRKLLHNFFPVFLRAIKTQAKSHPFKEERWFGTLFPIFWKYPAFWCLTVPAILLPPRLSKIWQILFDKIICLR